MSMNASYKDKCFSILGDSISTLEGCNPPDYAVFYNRDTMYRAGILSPADTWWGKVIDALGGRLLVNDSFSGSTVVWHPSYEIESYGCSDARTGGLAKDGQAPDVIMVYLGTNDWGCGIRVLPERGETSLAVFANAYGEMLKKLKINYPDAEIWCLTLMQSTWSAEPRFVFPVRCGGWHIDEYNDAIRACAKKANCTLIDTAKTVPYDTIDGLHPNAHGMQTIADAVLRGWERSAE